MIVVRARTFEEWKAILDYFYDKGYAWQYRQNKYNEIFFKCGRQLIFEEITFEQLKARQLD